MIARQIRKGAILILVALIQIYRSTISVMFAPRCRYTPTCSQYAIDALRKHGIVRGLGLSIGRISRCHPYSRRSGYDPVK